jgi:hypothetical protein
MKSAIKLWSVVCVIVVLLVAGASPVAASGGITVSGRWSGIAFANPEFDLDGDGVSGRQFDVRAFDQLPFASIAGAVDSMLIGFGCAGPGSLELKSLGQIVFRGRLGESLYVSPDPNAPNLCFDPANPNEVLQVVITGGTGPFAGATGTGTLTLHDTVLLTRIVTLPGVGPIPAPTLVDTRGEFTLHLQ